jgi:8-oxo-dGTP diphosphatase
MVVIIVHVCILQDDKILMIQEAKQKCRGMWNIPAGHLEDGEPILTGAIREAKEETGCDVELTGLLSIHDLINIPNGRYNQKQEIHFVFSAKIVGGAVTKNPNEVFDIKFMKVDDVIKMSDTQLRGGKHKRGILEEVLKNKPLQMQTFKLFDCLTSFN